MDQQHKTKTDIEEKYTISTELLDRKQIWKFEEILH